MIQRCQRNSPDIINESVYVFHCVGVVARDSVIYSLDVRNTAVDTAGDTAGDTIGVIWGGVFVLSTLVMAIIILFVSQRKKNAGQADRTNSVAEGIHFLFYFVTCVFRLRIAELING